MLAALCELVRRELLLTLRRSSDLMMTLFFFVMVASMFPLGMGPAPAMLQAIAPGVLWVAALLSCMLSLGRLFSTDYLDGTLEHMLLTPHLLTLLVLGKGFAHWVVSGLPIVLLSPILGVQYGLSSEGLAVLAAALLLGTPTLSLIGGIGAALTLGVRGGGLLTALLVLPLFVPVLIFGAGAVTRTAAGLGAEADLSLLGACLMVSVVFAPWATAGALRLAVESS